MEFSLALKYAGRHALKRNALVSRWCTELARRERIDPTFHRARQEQLLAGIYAAARRIPAYASLAARVPDGRGLAYLAEAFPIIDKALLRARPEEFFPERRVPRHRTVIAQTSGTTGTPLEVYRSFGSILREEAFHLQHWRWAGWNRGDRQAVLRGDLVAPVDQRRPPFWFHDQAGDQLVLSTRHLERATAPLFSDTLRRFGATQLRAYPSAAYELATFVAEAGVPVRFRSVITGSEMLYEFQRRRIEDVFQCRVFDSYGMTERVAFGAECEFGCMHVHPEYGVVEIVDAEGNPTDDEGTIVGTTLHNHVVPLIRYRMNDTARWRSEPCPCGRTYPAIERVSGRIADQLYDLDGRAVNCTVIGFAFDGLRNVERAQVVQSEPDSWVIRIVPGRDYSAADGERVLAKLSAEVSARVRARIELVDHIPSQPNGKYKWVIRDYQPVPAPPAAPTIDPCIAGTAC